MFSNLIVSQTKIQIQTEHPSVIRVSALFQTAFAVKMVPRYPGIFVQRMTGVIEFLRWSPSLLMMQSTITT